MASKLHLDILKKGPDEWNQWRKQHARTTPDLSSAHLSNLTGGQVPDLSGIDLSNANLRDAELSLLSLRFADLRMADFTRAKLYALDLTGANLRDARFVFAKINEVYFVDSNLANVDLFDASINVGYFQRAKLSGVRLYSTAFADCNMEGAEGLDSVFHKGPSSIGIDTIYASGGTIPEAFLRGCGVPENLIRYIPSLVNSEDGIQFYSCFISYSSKDEEFARRLHGRMRDAHLRVWFAPEDIQAGQKLHEQIETAIRVYDKLLIVLSEASLKSEWVMTELRNARKAEHLSGKRKLFPVRLVDFETLRDWECFDADSGKDLAVELREYFIPDFSNWKDHDQFEAAFSRLLKDLRAEERAT